MSSFPSTLLRGERYAVCGLGRNGASVASALLDMGAEVLAWDDHAPSLPAHEKLRLAPLTDLRGVEALILSPGIPHLLPQPHPVAVLARTQNVPILSDAEILWRCVRKTGSKARFVSVTGTNGKSTTTALLAHLLKEADIPVAAGGNLGAASLSLPRLGDDGVYVIEMSSYMLERLDRYRADAAILLNITPDHLERHGDMVGYAAAKAHVFDSMGADDLAVIAPDDRWCREIAERLRTRSVRVLSIRTDALPPHDAPSLPGRHNAQNIAACWAVARHLGLTDEQIRQGLRSFPGLEHRLQNVGEHQGVRFVNDSKATNAEASAHALRAYDQVMWICGGTAKTGGIETLAPLFGRVAKAFLIGRDAPLLGATLARHDVPHTVCETLESAVPKAFHEALAQGVKTVLLSPACASFDQYANFEARGSHFVHLCDSIMHGRKG